MHWAVACSMVLHALVHLAGFLQAFGFAQFPQIRGRISPALGLLWLAAALALGLALLSWFLWPEHGWLAGALALALSQAAIVSAWSDAKWGTLLNGLLAGVTVYSYLTHGPTSFRAEYRQQSAALAAQLPSELGRPILDSDLERLPHPVQRYLRLTGFVGQPRVLRYRLHFRGRIRGGPTEPWMSFQADQQSFTEPPSRLFLMSASRQGIPVQAFHQFVGGSARMRVHLAGSVALIDARGEDLDRSETVTLFNDMCLLAPGSLLSPRIIWQGSEDRQVRALFTYGAHTVSVTLVFDEQGLLRDFISDDRSRASPDGRSFTRLRFSTPVRDYRQYGPIRLASFGEARWHAPAPEGLFSYGEFELLDVSFAR